MDIKKHMAAVVAGGATVVLLVAGWVSIPMLRGADQSVDAQASLALERARRLLHAYDAGLAYKSLLVEQLSIDEIGIDPDDLSEELAEEYQIAQEAAWESYTPTDWSRDVPSPRRVSSGNPAGQIREGLAGQAQLAIENEQNLTDALAAVEQALSKSSGDANSRSHAEANRLKAVILYHTGLAEWTRARLRRRDAEYYRRELVALLADLTATASLRTLDPAGYIDTEVSRLRSEAANVEAIHAEETATLASFDETIRDLEGRLDDARTRAGQARQALDQLKAEGITFGEPDAVDAFRGKLEDQDRMYRQALREVRALEVGAYINARMDRPGEYLDGRYIADRSGGAPDVEFGLAHYQKEREVVAARIDGRRGVGDDLRSAIDRLQRVKTERQEAKAKADREWAGAVDVATELYDALNRLESEAFAAEDTAIADLDQAARTAQQASRFAAQWISDARDRTDGLAQDAAQRSAFQPRLRDGWMGAHIAAQEADARLAKAWLYHDRFSAYSQNAEVLGAVAEALSIAEVDVDAEREKATEARDAGINEISQARQVLDRVHRDADEHWTLAAQAASTVYVMTLFGHAGYRQDVIDGYQKAIQGREDRSSTAPFRRRLRQLDGS